MLVSPVNWSPVPGKTARGRRKRPESGWKMECRPAQTQVHVPGREMRTMVMGWAHAGMVPLAESTPQSHKFDSGWLCWLRVSHGGVTGWQNSWEAGSLQAVETQTAPWYFPCWVAGYPAFVLLTCKWILTEGCNLSSSKRSLSHVQFREPRSRLPFRQV